MIDKISQGGSVDEQVNHIGLSIVTPLTRHITLIVGRIQYFFNLKNKNKNISQNGVAPRSWRVLAIIIVSIVINPQSHIVEINKICVWLWYQKRRKKGEMEAIDSVFDPLREFAKDSVRLVKRCHKPDRKGIYLIANHIPNPPLCFLDPNVGSRNIGLF